MPHRLEVLQEYSREKRAYTKRDSAYWHEGGIEALRAKRREAVQRPAIVSVKFTWKSVLIESDGAPLQPVSPDSGFAVLATSVKSFLAMSVKSFLAMSVK